MKSARKSGGFTLLEILIAVAVFSILAATAYAALDRLADAAGYHRERAESFQDLQMTITRLDMDLRQLVTRSIRDEDRQYRPALEGEERRFEATRSGWANPLGMRRSELQRFAWQVDGSRLVHLRWPVTDRVPGVEPEVTEFLDDVRSLEFRYQDWSGQWQEQWPEDEAALDLLPRAVEYRLELEDGRSFVRLILISP